MNLSGFLGRGSLVFMMLVVADVARTASDSRGTVPLLHTRLALLILANVD